MLEDKLEQAQVPWQELRAGRCVVQDRCSTEILEEKAVWIETNPTDIVNSHTAPLRVTVRSKRL